MSLKTYNFVIFLMGKFNQKVITSDMSLTGKDWAGDQLLNSNRSKSIFG